MKRFALAFAVLLLLALNGSVSVQAQTPTEGERIARLEGAYEHLATKADIAELRTEIANVRTEIANVRTDVVAIRAGLNTMQWVIGTLIAIAGLGLGFAQYRLSQKINEALAKQPS